MILNATVRSSQLPLCKGREMLPWEQMGAASTLGNRMTDGEEKDYRKKNQGVMVTCQVPSWDGKDGGMGNSSPRGLGFL